MKHAVKIAGIVISLFLSGMALAAGLDINSATADQLAQGMVGIGKTKAEAIVLDREKNGIFKSVDDLSRVKGIKTNLIEKNRANITVGQTPAVQTPGMAAK
jgi:competence protein ComEA